jgi:hypothetical protein
MLPQEIFVSSDREAPAPWPSLSSPEAGSCIQYYDATFSAEAMTSEENTVRSDRQTPAPGMSLSDPEIGNSVKC